MEIIFSKPQSLKLISDKTYDGIYGLFYESERFLYVSFDESVATSGEYGTQFGFMYVTSDEKFEQLDDAILKLCQ